MPLGPPLLSLVLQSPSPHICLPPHSDGSVGEWVTAAGGHGQFSTSFVDLSFCPFAEELRPLQLQLEGLSDTSYLNFSVCFFIRDIGELRLAAAGSGVHPHGAGPHGGAALPGTEPRSARSATQPATGPDGATVGGAAPPDLGPPSLLASPQVLLLSALPAAVRAPQWHSGNDRTPAPNLPWHVPPCVLTLLRPPYPVPTLSQPQPQPGLLPPPLGTAGNRDLLGAQQRPLPTTLLLSLGW